MDGTTTRRGFLGRLAGAGALVASGGTAGAIEPIFRGKDARMKIACCAYSYRQFLTGERPSMTLEGFLDTCAGLGLDGVELTSYYFPPDADRGYMLGIRRRAFLLGLDVSGTAVGNRFTGPAGAEHDKQLTLVRTWIGHGEILGAPVIRVFAGNIPEGMTEDDAITLVAESCQACAEYGAQHGVMVALENHGGVTATADQVLRIVSMVDSDWFGVNLDTGNFHTADPYADMAKVAPYTITTHIKTEVRPEGKGAQPVDYGRVVSILREVGYRGYLSFEYEAAEDPMTALPRAVSELRAALA